MMTNQTDTPNVLEPTLIMAITRFRRASERCEFIANEDNRKGDWRDRFESATNSREAAAYSLAVACVNSDIVQQLEAENSALKAKLAELSRSKLDHGINTKLEYSLPKPPKDTIR